VNYREWREKAVAAVGYMGPFWLIVDANWTPAEQNVLARQWKEGTVT
jgi:hypothetical protein